MPNRIIKESIRASKTLISVSPEAERVFWRLVVSADDFGRFYGEETIVLGQCLTPLVGKVEPETVGIWLQELESAELIERYSVRDTVYLQITTWKDHQRSRSKTSKYPEKGSSRPYVVNSRSNDSNMRSNVVNSQTSVNMSLSNAPQYVNENENVFENGNVNENVFENGNVNENENGTSRDSLQAVSSPGTVGTLPGSRDTNSSSSLDLEFGELVRFYESSGFGMIDMTSQEMLTALRDEYGASWLIEAIKEAVMQNKRRLAYVKSILQNWKADGGIRHSGGNPRGQPAVAPNRARKHADEFIQELLDAKGES